MKSKAILSLFLTILFSSAIAQKVAIIGARHLNSTEDGVAILALDDLNAGEIYYFTDNNYDHPSDAFIYALNGVGSPIKEGVVKITIISAVTKGNVIYFKEIAPSSSNTYTFAVTPGTGTVSVQHVSSSGSFSIADFGESLYIYTDNDEDPANGVTEIHGAFFAGLLTNTTNFSGGPMPATENPISDYPNAVIVHNFPQFDYNLPAYINGVDRVEFNVSTLDRTDITRIELENPANYVYFGNDQDLSTTKFTNFNLTNSNPVVTLTRDFSQLTENSSSYFSYTFTVDTAPINDLVINFSVNGSSTYGIANFGSDFTQTGATTMNQTAGTVTISSGTTSKTIIINPTGDSDLEPDESFQLAITPGTGYTAGSPSVAGSVILNDDVLDVVPEVAIVGTCHYTDNEDGVSAFSFVALKDLVQGDAYFFSSNPFNKSTLLFEEYSTFPSAMKWLVPNGGVNRGDVMVVKKTGPDTFVLTRNGSTTSAGSVGKVSPSKKFYISPLSGYFRAHTDTDDDPFNGIEAIHSQVFTYEVTQGFGGNMPTTLDLSTLYSSSVLIDGFPNSSPGRLEYDPTLRPITSVDQSNFENPSNWLYAQPMQDLSPIPFGNIIVSKGSVNPKVTVAVSTSEILEDSETAVFTFSLDAIASSDITINFSVAGTAAYLSDYSVTGSSSFSGTNGSVTILNGTSSAQITLTPVGDSQLEKTETVLLTLTAGSAYDGGSPGNAELDILNDDADSVLPQLAIIGINHESPESMSLVAVNAISPNTTFYLTPSDLDKANLAFSGNAKFKFVSGDNCLPAGTVFTITGGIGGPLTVNCNGTSGAVSCGTASILNHVFSFLDIGSKYYVFQDNDEDQTNGFTQIHSVFHTGGSYPTNHTGGTLQPEENPVSIYSNAIVIDGFPASQPNRTEFDPSKRSVNVSETELENVSNYLHGQVNAALSSLNFDIIPLPLNLVTNTYDNGCGSLRYVIANSAPGDTIRFDPAIDGETIKLTSGQILINKDLVIIGNDSTKTIIDGQASSRIFEINSSSNIVISQLTIQNGGGVSSGGGILNNGELDLIECQISNNEVKSRFTQGGGISNIGTSAKLKIWNSHIIDNIANSSTGANGESKGGGIYNQGNGATIEIFNSKIAGNTVINLTTSSGFLYALGGGVSNDGVGAVVSLFNCQISGNKVNANFFLVSGKGGGLSNENNGEIILKNCTIAGNSIIASISANGGGIYLKNGTLKIQNSIVSNNSNEDIFKEASASVIDEGNNLLEKVTGNHGIVDGVNENSVGLDPLFSQNVLTSPSNGGDLRLQACSPAINAGTPDTTGLNLGFVDLDRNPRVFEGRIDIGAFEYQSLKPDPLVVTNTDDDGCGSLRFTITHSSSGDTIRFDPTINGDSIKLTTGQILIDKNLTLIGNGKDSTIIDGQALGRIFEVAANVTLNLDNLRLQKGDVLGNSGLAGHGGAIYVNGRLNISSSHFHDNKAVVGGALMSPLNGTADIFIDKSTFTSNISNSQGGVIGFGSDTLLVKNSTFSGNSTLDDAGVIRSINAGKVLLISSTFSGNDASSSGGQGGVMRDNGSSIEVNGCTFYGNSAWQGGAFHLETLNFSIQNSILQNSASDKGQDINIPGYSLNDLGNNLVFSTDGGHNITDGNNINPRLDVLADNGGPTSTHALLCDSPARDAGAGSLADQRGFTVFNGVKDIGAFESQEVYDPLLVINTNNNGCGSLRFIVTNAASGDTIRFDQSIDGDTIKLTSGYILLDKNLVILGNGTTSTIIDGMANQSIFKIPAGDTINLDGIKMQNGKGIFLAMILNFAGGAIFNEGNLQIKNCRISENNFSGRGGGLYNLEGKVEISNSTILNNNSSNGFGAGVYNNKGFIYFYKTIISGNISSSGGGVFNEKGQINFTDCIISGNSISFIRGVGGGVYSQHSTGGPETVCNFTNCLISGNYGASRGGGIYLSFETKSAITNCTISGNTAEEGGGVDILIVSGDDVDVNIVNTIISKNQATTGANIIGNYNSSNNLIGTDPLFVIDVPTAPSTGGDLRLQACSPAINAGTTDTTGLNVGLYDLDGNQRVIAGVIDIGAYESTVFELPSLTFTPSEFNDIYACENELTKIGLDFPNASAYTIQWQVSTGGAFSDLTESMPYSQVTSDTLEINPTALTLNDYQYQAIISNGCETVISDTFNLKVGATPTITLQPVNQIVCPNNEAILEVDVNGAGVSYQWQIDHGSGFVNVSGTEYYGKNSKKLLISNFDYGKSGKAFRCKVFTSCFEIISDPATITINTDVTILAQPMSQTVCEFATAIFTAQAVKLSAGTLTYQWQRKSGTGVWTNINSGGRYTVNGNQLSIASVPTSWNGAEFRCLMNDYCQTIPKTLNVIPVAHVTQNPVNQEICVGNNANFSVTATGQGLTYRWQVNSGSGFVNLTDGGIYQGATSANLSLSFPTAAVNGYQYRCIVSGNSTCDLVADTSAVASISIGVSAEAQTIFYNSPISSDDGVTQAVGYILGINDILAPNGKVEFRAGNAILLNPGFEVQAGAVFKAQIKNPCQTMSTSFEGGGKIPKEKVK